MEGKLIELATGRLLEKFGAGNHKPGSGSASALQGMISAQMVRTVIDLTNEPKRQKTYSIVIPELLKIKREIDERIYPELENLFQKDSEQFAQVIALRAKRDKENNPQKKRALSTESRVALIPATEILVNMAILCIELAEVSAHVFDYGFKSARGDSGVALNSAISAIASCLYIIELNLISLSLDPKSEKIRNEKEGLKLRYEELCKQAKTRLEVLEDEAKEMKLYLESISEFQQGNLAETLKSNSDIEKLVSTLQNTLWLKRNKIWKEEEIVDPMRVLQPETVLKKILDYSVSYFPSLGIYEHDHEMLEVAGIIDKNEKTIKICNRYPPETQNFTIAHELGHAILHKEIVLHRDRPIDGSTDYTKSVEEFQADKFAVFFLMPTKSVESIFIKVFETRRFLITESSVLGLRAGSVMALRNRCGDIRGLARVLASAEFYAGQSFNSMAKSFNVSVEAMAIRLEELNLLAF